MRAIWNSYSKSDMNRRPRTRTGIFRSFAKSTSSPAKGSTTIRSSFDVASRIMATRSSWLNTTPFSTRSATATVRWSNMRSARCIRSRCPFVTGSNVPANTARFMRLLFPRASRLPGAIERDRGLGVRAFGGDLECGRRGRLRPLPVLVYHESAPFGPGHSSQAREPEPARVPGVRRIEEDQMKGSGDSGRQLGAGEVGLVHARAGFESEPGQVFAQRERDRPAPLDKPRLARAAAQRLDPERAGPGVEVEHPRVRDATRTQHVEDRFAGAVRRRTDAAGGDLDPPPAQLAA